MTLSQEEILSLLLARKLLSGTSGGYISDGLGKFGRKLMTESGSSRIDGAAVDRRFSATWTGHTPAQADTFGLVCRALLTSRRLSFDYTSPCTGQRTHRTVEPHHLQYYMASWVLTAWCRLRHEWRKFYIARMGAPAILDEPFTPRPEKAWRCLLDSAYGIFQGSESVTVVLRFTPARAGYIREQIWHPCQEMVFLENGQLELRLPVADFREIRMKILQFGADVFVVEPAELRDDIAEEIRKMAGLY